MSGENPTTFFDESSLGGPPLLKDQPKPQKSPYEMPPPGAAALAATGKNTHKNKHSTPANAKKDHNKKDHHQLSKDSVRSLNDLETHQSRKEKSVASPAGNHNTHNNTKNKSLPGAASSTNNQQNSNNTNNNDMFKGATGELGLETAQELQEESDQINQLVEAQRQAAMEGRYLDAHLLQKRVKESGKQHQQHVDNDLHFTKMNAIFSSREVTHSHKEKMMIFTTEWEKMLGEFERRAAEEKNNLASRHQRELAEQEEITRGQIAARWQNVRSKDLTEAQHTTQRLASQQFYYEAHQAQAYAEKLEAKEIAEKEAKFQRELLRRMNALRTAKAKEMGALDSRIESAREALLTQRARDYEVLVLKQYNKQVTDEQKVRVDFGKRRTEMQRQMVGAQARMGKRTQLPPLQSNGGVGNSIDQGLVVMSSSSSRNTTASNVNNNHNNAKSIANNNNNNKNGKNNATLGSNINNNTASSNPTGVLNTVGITYEGKDDLPLPITAQTNSTTRPPSGNRSIPRPPSAPRN